MSLTRDDLENDSLRAAIERSQGGLPLFSRAAFNASLNAMLHSCTRGADVWVFAYGSLIWNPLIHTVEREPVTLHGFHRRYCLWSRLGRGTPEYPGLMLGLDFGGSCRGVAMRVAAGVAEHELKLLWRREMVLGSYAPRWVSLHLRKGTVRAIAFVVNHGHPHYAGKLGEDTMVKTITTARGHLGPCIDYLENTLTGLAAHGIHDRGLVRLHRLIEQSRGKRK
jgi:cation transport protein ChaC